MQKRRWLWLAIWCWGAALPGVVRAETLTVAAASNLAAPLQELAAQFEQQEGVTVKVVTGASGILAAQVAKRAPYDLFLAADGAGPARLKRNGQCGEPFAYATGELVLWVSQDLNPAIDWQGAVRSHWGERIALANPATAPYGMAARDLLVKAGLWERLASRLVYGQNVGQAFQFAYQGSAELALVALSSALSDQGREGVYYSVPEASLLDQQGCVVRRSKNKKLAERFRQFLLGEAGQAVLRKYGYEPPAPVNSGKTTR
ncbi:MAG: molybdate ABC transporter substrate-binding protein [Thermodesulfobacteriota bacterium]